MTPAPPCPVDVSVIAAVGQAKREGIAEAKREARYEGRVPTVRRQAAKIIRLKEAGVTPAEIAVRLGIGRASISRDQRGRDQQVAA